MNDTLVRQSDVRYEKRVVTLLALGTALMGIDRYMVLPMMPALMRDLHFTYLGVGGLAGVLGITYGCSSLAVGWLSDRIGRRQVIIVGLLAFSLLVGISGLAASFLVLLVLRAILGTAHGAFMTPAIVTTLDVSQPHRKGRNLGLQLMMLPLFGLALSPIVVTQLLGVMSWRLIFGLTAPFGLAITYGLYLVLRRTSEITPDHTQLAEPPTTSWHSLFRYRNVWICMALTPCWMTSQVALTSMLPNYFIDHMHLSRGAMGFILSATGFGGALGMLVLSGWSDRVGRRMMMLAASAGSAALLIALMFVPASPVLLFAVLLVKNFFTFPLIGMTLGPAVAEAVPANLRASATGLITFIGEIIGGGISPIIGGKIADMFGIGYIFVLPLIMLGIGFFVSCFLIETAPRLLAAETLISRRGFVAPDPVPLVVTTGPVCAATKRGS